MMSSHAEADAGIRARVTEYTDAYNRGDAAAIAGIYAEDGTHTYALGFTQRGRAEIEAGLRDMFVGPFKGTQMQITPEHIRAISHDVAIEEASFILTGLRGPDGVEMGPIRGLCLGVYQKQGDTWFAAAVQCLVPPSAPGS